MIKLLLLVFTLITENDMKPYLYEQYVIRPTLAKMQAHDPRILSDAAIVLMMGTVAQESDMGAYRSQIGGGPALGTCQVERLTEKDIRGRYLERPENAALKRVMEDILIPQEDIRDDNYYWAQLETNDAYCVFIARVKYWMKPFSLPPADNLYALGAYYKNHYNADGKGSADEWVESYNHFVLGER